MGEEAAAAIASAAIAAAGSGVSAGITSGRGHKSQKRALRYNKELAQYQYDLNMQGWREQMAYNTPAAQMARYQEAGLNPRLIYGQGDNGNAGVAPEYQAHYQDPEPVNDFGVGAAVDKGLQAWLAMKQFEEQRQNNLVNREAIQMKTLSEAMQQLRYGQEYAKNDWEFREAQRLGMSQAAVMFSNIQGTQQQIRESSQRVLNLQQEYELAQKMNPIKVSIAEQQLKDLQQTHDWNSFQYNLRRRLKLLPGMDGWNQVIAFGLDAIDHGKDSDLGKMITTIKELLFGSESDQRKADEIMRSSDFLDLVQKSRPWVPWMPLGFYF